MIASNKRHHRRGTLWGERFKICSVENGETLIKRYRRYVYEAGAVSRSDKGAGGVIDEKMLAEERAKEFNLDRVQRFRYRTRYFTDSGIIGTKAFVAENYLRFKHLFQSKHEKKPKMVTGIEGLYSLKRLSEVA